MDVCDFQTILISGKIDIEIYSQWLLPWREDLITRALFFLTSWARNSTIKHSILLLLLLASISWENIMIFTFL